MATTPSHDGEGELFVKPSCLRFGGDVHVAMPSRRSCELDTRPAAELGPSKAPLKVLRGPPIPILPGSWPVAYGGLLHSSFLPRRFVSTSRHLSRVERHEASPSSDTKKVSLGAFHGKRQQGKCNSIVDSIASLWQLRPCHVCHRGRS